MLEGIIGKILSILGSGLTQIMTFIEYLWLYAPAATYLI